MNPAAMQNPLSQLRDIHLPDAVSWWPLAWPWWVMLVLLLAIIVLTVYWRKKQAWRRIALKQFNQLIELNDHDFARASNRLLKQVALNKLGKESAGYSGIKWLQYLDQQVKTPLFLPNLEGFSQWIDDPNSQVNRNALEHACSTWIRKVQC